MQHRFPLYLVTLSIITFMTLCHKWLRLFSVYLTIKPELLRPRTVLFYFIFILYSQYLLWCLPLPKSTINIFWIDEWMLFLHCFSFQKLVWCNWLFLLWGSILPWYQYNYKEGRIFLDCSYNSHKAFTMTHSVKLHQPSTEFQHKLIPY